MRERKYFTEFGLGVYASYKTLIAVDQLDMLEQYDKRKYHIYYILACPRVFIRMDKTYPKKDGIHITLFEINGDEEVEHRLPIFPITGKGELDYDYVTITSMYPFTKLQIEIKDLAFLKNNPDILPKIELTTQMLFDMSQKYIKGDRRFEVLYVGQAFGKRGERTALVRLSSHSTLQKILIDTQSEYPDKYIYILLLEMNNLLNMSFDGRSKKYSTSNAEDDIHITKILNDLPIEQQVINISEAAMINYFKPPYNEKFVENFPDEKHKGYRQYFDLDYNCLTVEIDLEFENNSSIQLYSKTNKLNNIWDIIRYDLFNDPNRKNMYDIFK